MKYSITTNDSTIEFGSYSDAESYCISNGISTGSIIAIPNNITSTNSGFVDVYQQKLDDGYPIPNTPYVLAMADSDRAQFTGMLVLIGELLSAGYITGDTPQVIKDKNGNTVHMTTDEFRSLMIGYGIYYKTTWNQYFSVS
jgi:hypothetical protein